MTNEHVSKQRPLCYFGPYDLFVKLVQSGSFADIKKFLDRYSPQQQEDFCTGYARGVDVSAPYKRVSILDLAKQHGKNSKIYNEIFLHVSPYTKLISLAQSGTAEEIRIFLSEYDEKSRKTLCNGADLTYLFKMPVLRLALIMNSDISSCKEILEYSDMDLGHGGGLGGYNILCDILTQVKRDKLDKSDKNIKKMGFILQIVEENSINAVNEAGMTPISAMYPSNDLNVGLHTHFNSPSMQECFKLMLPYISEETVKSIKSHKNISRYDKEFIRDAYGQYTKSHQGLDKAQRSL